MVWKKIAAVAALAALTAACNTVPRDMSVAEYCADGSNAAKDVCKMNVEIDGQKRALSETNMSVHEARNLATRALSKADAAALEAAEARSMASAALARNDNLYCETRTIQKTNIGSCSPGYKVVSCQQTRYTYRAGGLSFLREINDEQCRFNERVLEMQVRCCMAGGAPSEVQERTDTTDARAYTPAPGY